MRISDWSSDVCSSDLLGTGPSIQRLRRHSGRTDGGKDSPMSSAKSAMYRIERKTPQPVHAERRIKKKASPPVHAECRIKRKPHNQIGRASCRERAGQNV